MVILNLTTMIVMMLWSVTILQVQVFSTCNIGNKPLILALSKPMTTEALSKTLFTMVSQPHQFGNYQIFESQSDYLQEPLISSPIPQT